ncbi:DUF2971 domain-containing protein [Andreprevotia sp. IGB-42]
MWSHYADSHKGVVIGFNFDEKSPKSLFYGSANIYEGSHTENPT